LDANAIHFQIVQSEPNGKKDGHKIWIFGEFKENAIIKEDTIAIGLDAQNLGRWTMRMEME
jgi:hypothetical protein